VGLCGEDHQDSATAHIEVGKILAAQGDLEDAFEEIDQAKAVREVTLGKEHVETGRAYGLIGTINSMEGRFDEAVGMHKRALSILEKNLGFEHAEVEEAREKLEMAENEEAETEL
jgi:tetratricopeptide (TPR) repeat protein